MNDRGGSAKMFSFLLGLAAGATVLLNGPQIRRGVARAALTGGEAAAALGRQARKVSATVVEDFEDAFAEARAEKTNEEEQRESVAALQDELRQLRAEISALTGSMRPGNIQ